MKILVTGAAGFIGSHLAEKLVQRGYDVVGLDNFNDIVYPARTKRENASRLARYSGFRLIEADVRDRERMLALFEAEGFDAVAHLAALAGVRNAVKYPDVYIDVNYKGSQNLMDGARLHGVGNFVFASTSSVYGNTQRVPFVEDDACDRPLQPYAAAKRGIEILGYTYHYLFGLNFTAIRFFSVYGPHGRPDMMVYKLAESITKGIELPYYNNGEMYRDWTYVADITDGVAAALARPLGYEIINLGRGEPVLLRAFVAELERLAGRKANLTPRPKPAADVVQNCADISKARRLLDYQPEVNFVEGIARFWAWYVERVENQG